MDIDPQNYPQRDVYKLMTAAVVPRPIAWVSTLSPEGVANVAPFSFFNAVCSAPPTVLFCSSIRASDGGNKDTYHNIKANGEFVVNFVTYALADAMNITATDLPPDVSEFDRAKLTPAPGHKVAVPHVAESPAYFECVLKEIVTISEEVGGAHIIIGTVVHMHFDDSIFREGNYLDYDAYDVIGRLAGNDYSRIKDRVTLVRPKPQV